MKKKYSLLFVITLLVFSVTYSQPGKSTKDSSKAKDSEPLQVTTHHSIVIQGKTLNYSATTGTFALQGANDSTIALIGFTSYVKDGEKDSGSRPITFAYNGGPGSSSVWLHMGALGPKRVVLDDPNSVPPPPYKTEDNGYSIIDVTDLVMIDPVGTGLSKAVGRTKGDEFWGVNEDIKSISEFIFQYIRTNNRWNSPKFLLGESYGTTRSAGVSDYLFERMGITVNGIIFVSTVFDFQTLSFNSGNDLPYILFLPTYAAVAYYHHALPAQPEDLASFLQTVRDFSQNEYADALFKGVSLDSTEFSDVVDKLHEYTGLSKTYLRNANLRVSEPQFTDELLREKGETVGRLDSRYTGPTEDLLSEYSEYDPQSSAITSAFTSVFLNYLHNDLKYPDSQTYKIDAYRSEGFKWNWSRLGKGRTSAYYNVYVSKDLSDIMAKDPYLNILFLNGYYDLATPFFATEYTANHLGNNIPHFKDRVHMKYFKAGHMMYINKDSLPLFKSDIADFIKSMSNIKKGN